MVGSTFRIQTPEDYLADLMTANVLDSSLINMLPQYLCDDKSLDEDYFVEYENETARRILLLHEKTNVLFSANEIEYFDDVSLVSILVSELDLFRIICIDIQSERDNADLFCCALIKIFDKAFMSDNIYCFRKDRKISFGCGFRDDEKQPFAITRWLGPENMILALEIIGGHGDEDSLRESVKENSSLQGHYEPDEEQEGLLIDYIARDGDDYYAADEDYDSEDARFETTNDSEKTYVRGRLMEFRELLRNIGSGDTAYSIYERAKEAEALKANDYSLHKDESLDDSVVDELPEDVLADPEKMLEYL